MPISFSTSWMDGDISKLYDILPYIDALEVGSRGEKRFYDSIEELICARKLTATSIHAVAGPHKEQHDSYYTPHFASPNDSMREKDCEQVALTAEWALKLGIKAVVLHIGNVEDESLKNDFFSYKKAVIENGSSQRVMEKRVMEKRVMERRRELMERRKRLGGDYIEAAAESLRFLCGRFPKLLFAIETRLHFHEIPLPNEVSFLFERLPYSNLGYWHDIGHTAILDALRLVSMHEWQRKFSSRCIGLHIHDVDHTLVDHYPPGCGRVNLRNILSQFNRDSLFTLELNQRHTIDTVIRGIDLVREMKT